MKTRGSGWKPIAASSQSDGLYTKAGHTLRVEAKRVQSTRQLNKNISRAEEQIKARQVWMDNREPFGLIALDVTRLINEGEKYLDVKSESEALVALRQAMEKACGVSNSRCFNNPLLLGTMLYADAAVLLRSQNCLVHAGQLDFLINGSKTAFYRHIAARIFSSIRGISRRRRQRCGLTLRSTFA